MRNTNKIQLMMSQKFYQFSQKIGFFKITLTYKSDLIAKNGCHFLIQLQNGLNSDEKT